MGEAQATFGLDVRRRAYPKPAVVLELLKPITWFPPMWAFLCGALSAGAPIGGRWLAVVGGVVLAGPLVCAASQAANDWFDRHVDAINEPDRPIPSGRMPGRWGLWVAFAWTALSLLLAAALGSRILIAAGAALVLAWTYSAPPVRLKGRGWLGPLSVGFSYEGVAWFTGAVLMTGTTPRPAVLGLVVLYSLGGAGIMVLNDFKAVEGDRRTGVRSVPAELGPENAAPLACAVMAAPQAVVVALLLASGRPLGAALVLVSLLAQGALMRRLLTDPARLAPWYNGTGVLLFVLGMLASGLSIGHGGGAP